MYQVENTVALTLAHRALASRRLRRAAVSRTVLLLGLTSLLTDISAEMVATVLPLFLVVSVGLTPLQYGLVDGIYQGGAALVRVASGFVADRWRRHKEVAVVGYGLSAACKPLFLLAGTWSAVSGLVLVDRAGKGIRTAPRDAMISLSTPTAHLGTAFGVHRALDTTGAMLGPLIAFGLLALSPLDFDPVFIVSFCFALVGLAVLALFVRNPEAAEEQSRDERPHVSLRAAARLLAGRPFRGILVAAAALALATASDGFLYLRLQRTADLDFSLFPLLFVGTAAAYMLLAVPTGRLADRIGRGRVFLGGYGLLLLAYLSLLLPGLGLPGALVLIAILGGYYAASDGVLMALASAVLPEHLRGSGLALLVTATSGARLFASVLFGALWTAFGASAALACFSVTLTGAIVLAATMLFRMRAGAALV
jgi:MFS family permease